MSRARIGIIHYLPGDLNGGVPAEWVVYTALYLCILFNGMVTVG